MESGFASIVKHSIFDRLGFVRMDNRLNGRMVAIAVLGLNSIDPAATRG